MKIFALKMREMGLKLEDFTWIYVYPFSHGKTARKIPGLLK